MTEDVERVARVLWMAMDRSPCLFDAQWANDPIMHKHWSKLARAAIRALREPSEAIVDAAEATIYEHMPEPRDWTVRVTKEGWQAGIDAALGEGR